MQYKIVGTAMLSWVDNTGKRVYQNIDIDELIEADDRGSAINKVKADYESKHSAILQKVIDLTF